MCSLHCGGGGFILSADDVPEVCELFAWAMIETVELSYQAGGAHEAGAGGGYLMNALWPAITAVFGTLAGVFITQWFAARERAAAFRREWLKAEGTLRLDLYNEIIAKLHRVGGTFDEALRATEEFDEPTEEVAARLIEKVEQTATSLFETIRSKRVLASSEMLEAIDSFLNSLAAASEGIAGPSAKRADFKKLRDLYFDGAKAIESRARREVSIEGLLERL